MKTSKPTRRQQIEAEVRAVGRRCRGPRETEGAKVVRRLVQTAHPDGAAAQRLLGSLAAGATTDQLLTALFAAGLKPAAAAVDEAARSGCGADLNDLILAHPLDGQPKSASCPRCGTDVHWTPAPYEEPAGG